MNDRFLFRGKRVDNGEWVIGRLICINSLLYEKPKDAIQIQNGKTKTCNSYVIIPETVGQCTGLKDKHGKLIFKGDIVVNRDISGSGKAREFNPRAVIWKQEYCGFNVSAIGDNEEIEIIGNIHKEATNDED